MPAAVARRAMDGPEAKASRQPVWPQAQRGPTGVDDGVADLAGEAAGAAVEPAIEHDAGRDAGADGEVGEVAAVEAVGGAAPVQAERGGSGVVLDDDGPSELRLEGAAEVEVGPAEVHGEGHVAGHGIHAAGDADADRVEVVALQAGGGEGLVERGRDGGGGAVPGRRPTRRGSRGRGRRRRRRR